MDLINNNIKLHTGDSREIAIASHNSALELDPTVAYIVTMKSLKPLLLKKGYTPKATTSKLSQKIQEINNTIPPLPRLAVASEKMRVQELPTHRRKYSRSLEREEMFKHLKSLDTEKAYMYLITTLLPFLQNQSSERLEEQGNTMKQISKLYDKWNEIQNEINTMAVNIRKIFKDKIIKDQKVNFWDIIDYKEYKIGKFNDPKHLFDDLLKSKKVIDKKVEEFQKFLQEVEKKLPSSAQTLVKTLKELAPKLKLNQSTDFNFYYWDENEMRFEILAKDANLENNQDHEKMSRLLTERLEKVYGIFIDSDQTKFKAYMDNIAQGITALTSISNMTQQQLQIDTQYYNSLLGFQKSAQDSINKTIQTALNNTRA